MPILQGRDRVPSDVRITVRGSQRLGSRLGAGIWAKIGAQIGSVLAGILAILALWFLVPAGPTWAETTPTIAAPAPPLALDSATIPAEQLSRFVRAYLDVFTLIDQREGDLQSAETETLSLRIRQEIEAEAYRRIEATGMSRQEYIQILSLANIDPELGEQIAAQLQEAGTEMP
jgi:hypothetical protein